MVCCPGLARRLGGSGIERSLFNFIQTATAIRAFYLVFSTSLLIIWLMMFFVFDRLTYWRIRPGQMTEEHVIGGGAESFDTNGLRFQKLSSDFFRATLGLGAGDLRATAARATIEIPNVIFVGRKVHAIEKLISVKPERACSDASCRSSG